MKYAGNCWPNPTQLLLLKSALLAEPEAKHYWHKYIQIADLQNIDHVSTTFLPLIFKRFKRDRLPQLSVCASVYRHTWAFNQLQFLRLRTVIAALETANIESCLLKGAAMAAAYYQDLGARVMGDIDLWVPKDKICQAIGILKQLGWKLLNTSIEQLPTLMNHHHAVTLTNKDNCQLDLHWAILSDSALDPLLASYRFTTEKTHAPEHQLTATILSPEDQLIHTLFHGLKYSPQPLIRWIPDTVTILNKTPRFNWEYFIGQAKKLHIMLTVKMGLSYLQEKGFIDLPATMLKALQSYRPTRKTRKHFEWMTHPPRKFFAPYAYLWYWHIRSSQSENSWVLIWTLPTFLKRFWRLESTWQVPGYLIRRIVFHAYQNLHRLHPNKFYKSSKN